MNPSDPKNDQPESQQPVSLSDRQLAIAAAANDLDAYEQLVRRYQNPLVCFLQIYCRGRHDVEDIAQEAFLKCFLHIDQFDPDRSFKTWLYTIARRSIPRSKSHVNAKTESIENASLTDPTIDPVRLAQQTESRNGMWQVVRNVSNDDEFQLVWLRYAEGLSIAEIASVFGDSRAACKMRLSRIRRRLKKHLAPFLFDNFQNSSIPLTMLAPKKAA